jgi:crotonobetaine/carnitine-CoA ligase
MPYIPDRPTVRALLEARAARDGARVYCRFGDEAVTFAALDRRVNRLASALLARGIGPGDRVPLMLANHPAHLVAFFALHKLGAIQVPVNTHLRGAGLEYPLRHSEPKAMIVDAAFAERLVPALEAVPVETVIWHGGAVAGGLDFAALEATGADTPPALPGPGPDDVVSISYTSGTTGPPKGVMVTDKMFRCAAHATTMMADVKTGDVMFLWEPLYHIGGSQVMVTALIDDIEIALVEGFSASAFWGQVRTSGATQIHFLGGVLQILLRQPPDPRDRDHRVRVAWGGGAPTAVSIAFTERFGIPVHESYGMTEASSMTSINTEGRTDNMGRPTPYFEVRIARPDGQWLPPGESGEILVREREPGLLMKGYFRNPEATASTLVDGWLHTGDLGRLDVEGYLTFRGRLKDSIRRGGENVSAWEVEHVVIGHPGVEECAIVGVEAKVGEQDIKLFIKAAQGQAPAPEDIIAWCETDLARFQLPRYVAFIDEFPKTATHRIRKDGLSRAIDDCWDREAKGG